MNVKVLKSEFARKCTFNFAKVFTLIWLTIAQVYHCTAQRTGPRPDINSFGTSDQKLLCDAILDWITTDLVSMHAAQFGPIHVTEGFLPWHREHILDLEEYLMEHNLSQFVPLPKWNPNSPIPNFFNGRDKFGNSGYQNIKLGFVAGNSQTYSTPNIALQGKFVKHTPNPSGSANDLCDYWNAAKFSDDIETQFHNGVHGSVGGIIGTAESPSAALFWIWHAFVDDVWFNWDCECKMKNGDVINGTTITFAYDEVANLVINGTVTFDGNVTPIKKVRGKIIINPGGELILKNGFVLEMLGNEYMCDNDGIIVEKGNTSFVGGILRIESGAIIRGISTMGKDGRDGLTIGLTSPNYHVKYNNYWSGITVKGDANSGKTSSLHGKVILDGKGNLLTGIRFANLGIKSIDGGIVNARQVTFLNCKNGVELNASPNTKENASQFNNCVFKWEPQANYKTYMHYVHSYHDQYHISLNGVEDIDIAGCQFLNDEPNKFIGSGSNHEDLRGSGIISTNAVYYLHKDGVGTADPITGCPVWTGTNNCKFANLTYGIHAVNTANKGHLAVQDAEFTNCHDAIECTTGDKIMVHKSIFNYDFNTAFFDISTNSDHHHFLISSNNKSVGVFENTMNTNDENVAFIGVSNNASNNFSRVTLNVLTNTGVVSGGNSRGVEVSGDNSKTDITCNTFTGMNAAINNFGILKNQAIGAKGAGNEFIDAVCINGPEQHLMNSGTASTYTYFGHQLSSAICSTATITYMPSNPNPKESDDCKINCNDLIPFLSIRPIKFTDQNIKIYPNPSSRLLNIDLGSNFNPTEMEIILIDMLGRRVVTLSDLKLNNIIFVGELAQGVYNIIVMQKNMPIKSQKISIQH